MESTYTQVMSRTFLFGDFCNFQITRPVLRAALALACLFKLSLSSLAAAGTCPPLLDHRLKSLQSGQVQDLCQYAGKVLLVVNTASYCGNTHQYAGLEALYREYKDRGLVVLGFPSNDFGQQEPGSNEKIANFCRMTYGVEFPMVQKSRVIGADRLPFYAELEKRTNKVPRWNFHKYLIDARGQRVVSFESSTLPDDPRLMRELKAMLAQRR